MVACLRSLATDVSVWIGVSRGLASRFDSSGNGKNVEKVIVEPPLNYVDGRLLIAFITLGLRFPYYLQLQRASIACPLECSRLVYQTAIACMHRSAQSQVPSISYNN